MSAVIADWQDIPDRDYERYLQRLRIVELLLEEAVPPQEKRRAREQFCEDHRVSLRTLGNWLARYRKAGPAGLMFVRSTGVRSLRIANEPLREKILELVHELPSRSVARLRRLIGTDLVLAEAIARVSDRSIYRFLQENGLGIRQRQSMAGERAGRAYHHFEAACSLALVQGDARDGIWLPGPDGGKPRKTYLFVWVDDYSRKILFGKYYLDEKLPCLEDSFKLMVLRWGIPHAVYLDNGAVYISKQFASVLAELRIKGIHHRPYQAWCKGNVEYMKM